MRPPAPVTRCHGSRASSPASRKHLPHQPRAPRQTGAARDLAITHEAAALDGAHRLADRRGADIGGRGCRSLMSHYIDALLRLQSMPRGVGIRSRDGPSSNRHTFHPSTDGLAHHDRHHHRGTHASSLGTRAEFRIRTLVVCAHGSKRAPYFGTIRPSFLDLQPKLCRVAMKKRRAVENHIGTVHALAMGNLCELAAGMCTEVTIPGRHALDSARHDHRIPRQGRDRRHRHRAARQDGVDRPGKRRCTRYGHRHKPARKSCARSSACTSRRNAPIEASPGQSLSQANRLRGVDGADSAMMSGTPSAQRASLAPSQNPRCRARSGNSRTPCRLSWRCGSPWPGRAHAGWTYWWMLLLACPPRRCTCGSSSCSTTAATARSSRARVRTAG